jgi:CubicO group peptidase (beta-lactamase class C family)
MAKFGYLYLNNGTWDGEQILTHEWVTDSSESHIMLFGDTGYGYQWWVMDRTMGIYDARGMYGQRIIIIPKYDMVVVFVSSGTEREEELFYNFILAAVTDAPPIGEFDDALVYVSVFLAASVAISAVSRARARQKITRRL